MNLAEPIDIRTGRPFADRVHPHHREAAVERASTGGRARGLLGGLFGGCLMAAQDRSPLPSGYTVATYVDTNGGASYANTGLVVNYNHKITCRAMCDSLASRFIYGCGTVADLNNGLQTTASGRMYISFGGVEFGSTNAISANVAYDFEAYYSSGSQYLKVDGDTWITSTRVGSYSTQVLMICKQGLSRQNQWSGRLYGRMVCTKDDGTEVFHYYTARRDSDGTYGLYDTVSDTFLASATSTPFTGAVAS